MARDGASAERRRVALRVLLARGEGSSSSSPPPRGPEEEARRGKQQWLALRLRDLGCASAAASRAHAPVAASASVRPAPDALEEGEEQEGEEEWRGARQQRRRRRRERRSARGAGGGGLAGAGGGVAGDVWCTCTPGIPFAAEASSVDCVVARHHTAAPGRRGDGERRHRERTAEQRARRVTMREHISSSFMDSPPRFHMPFHDADLLHSGRHRHAHPYDRTDQEIMMFRTRLLLGRMGMYDQYQDWRLDVDNMNYEELLALEDRIGYVSTGLREDEIVRGLRVGKHLAFDRKHFSTEMERSCSICQEEFEASEEIGRLSCGHGYHVHCIKQWLSRKNACPLCKVAISKP
ncbi:hypothetical protein CFC21_003823 [Triticum aestivum]|uniref:RING-type E3 ubiquitin transferase n=1 Tax=Triticum aestivum TaxID=4565 RepID=A0A3B5Y6F9_WHEAT|nr:E3 ubiquitin-protein ligase MBR2-like [Triticum aestivum]KAF6986029.1 hypothetical protein CFC21_003823 [Triticum aestivum]